MLSGKKTYLVAALGAVVVGVYFLGGITEATCDTFLGLLGLGGLATLRAALKERLSGGRAARPPASAPLEPPPSG